MKGERPELRRGRIIWAAVRDRRGALKQRPVIILTATEDIREDEPLICMAVTTSFGDPPPADHVPLPWHPRGQVITKLRSRSAAVVSWIVEVDPVHVLERYGDVPVALIQKLVDQLEQE